MISGYYHDVLTCHGNHPIGHCNAGRGEYYLIQINTTLIFS